MYSLAHFTETDFEKVYAFMIAHPFVTLCGCSANGKPVATQIPVLIKRSENQITLSGHFMRKTDHHAAFTENPKVLALFTGAHEYVSASWYSNPVQASTWNYMSVHARGTMHFQDDEKLMQVLRDTTTFFENNPTSPASFDNLPAEYIDRLSKAIIAFEIVVEEIGNVFKLSQNRDKKSFTNIIEKLREKSEDGKVIADEMEKRTDMIK